MRNQPLRVLIADDQEFVRVGLSSLIGRFRPQWEIVGLATDGRQAVELVESFLPDLIVVELTLPGVDGLTVIERLSRCSPSSRIMILTDHPPGQLSRTTRKMGACAFVSKHESPFNLLDAMERVIAGEPFFNSETFDVPPAARMGARGTIPTHYLLTGRELDVLRHLARGSTNKETASALGMSVRTAESHRANILYKLGATSLGDLVRIALRDGLA